jgi:hypothetical protein
MVMDDYPSVTKKNSKTNVLAKASAKEISCAYRSENFGCGIGGTQHAVNAGGHGILAPLEESARAARFKSARIATCGGRRFRAGKLPTATTAYSVTSRSPAERKHGCGD